MQTIANESIALESVHMTWEIYASSAAKRILSHCEWWQGHGH